MRYKSKYKAIIIFGYILESRRMLVGEKIEFSQSTGTYYLKYFFAKKKKKVFAYLPNNILSVISNTVETSEHYFDIFCHCV